jgi:hypothetical protein
LQPAIEGEKRKRGAEKSFRKLKKIKFANKKKVSTFAVPNQKGKKESRKAGKLKAERLETKGRKAKSSEAISGSQNLKS